MEQKPNDILNEADWLVAYDHLNMVIAEHVSAGSAAVANLYIKLLPLKRRYDAGIRTRQLYNEIMDCE